MNYFNNTFNMQPKIGKNRLPIYHVAQGDTISIQLSLHTPTGKVATRDNSVAVIYLVDRRFSVEPIWEGSWQKGLTTLNKEGLVSIDIPLEISERLRRGSFMLSVNLSAIDESWKYTPFTGYIYVEYAATSPEKDVPYHTKRAIRTPKPLVEVTPLR